jgi:predicted metal-dependent phosphoesterase TrpH
VARPSRHDETAWTWDPIVPPAPSTIDLHTHTLRSDGVLEPAELVRQAFEAGIRLLAITDHDSLAAYRELTASGGVPAGLDLLPGVEINAVADGRDGLWEGELHILGFGMGPSDERFEATLAAQRGRRRQRFERILARLRDLGMPVDDAVDALGVGADDALGRPTVARALIAKGHATSVEDAFQRWLGHGQPAWVPRDGLGPRDAIAAIRDAGGIAVLAHFVDAHRKRALVRELAAVGLGGLEAYYRGWNEVTIGTVRAVADRLGLLVTGGSDYHGDLGPYADSYQHLWVPPEVGRDLREAVAAGR